ncbi:MAG: chemotaxis protein CheD [candidate division KSB1 bacterium]|nr:chemotaxis protein CheD [candidate division KSB1 bacterium]
MRYIVGIAEMMVSTNKGDVITTHALGSCLGIAIHDPVACVGGLLHVMMPLSTIDPVKAAENPCLFVDTGVPKLFLECYKAGAQKQRLEVKVAGGACIRYNGNGQEEDFFQIGKRNFIMLRKLLWKNGLLLKSYDVGGSESRTMSLEIGSGEVIVKVKGNLKRL